MLFQLRAERQAERAQLAANFAASSRGRGMASLDKGLRPEPLGQIPDIRVRAARATREVHFAYVDTFPPRRGPIRWTRRLFSGRLCGSGPSQLHEPYSEMPLPCG